MRFSRAMLKLIGPVVLLSSFLTACSQSAPKDTSKPSEAAAPKASQEPIRIALAAPLTGSAGEDGTSIHNAAKLVVEQTNKAGGVLNRKLELVPFDDKCDPKEGAAIANKVASDSSIVAVIGNYCSSVNLAGVPILKRAGVPQVAPAGTSPALSGASPYFRRVIVTDAVQGADLVKWAREQNHGSAAIVFQNTDFGRGVAEVVEKEFTAAGGKIVAKESYTPTETTDYGSVITKVKNANPDVIFMGSVYAESALFLKQARRAGLKTPVMSVGSMYTPAFLKLAGEDAEGAKLVGVFIASNPDAKVQAFVKDYQAAYGTSPSQYAALAYDAANIIVDAIKRAGKAEREAINEALRGAPEHQGVTGTSKFDDKGDAIKPMLRLTVKDGQFELWKK